MKTIFNTNFYYKFTPPNSKELIRLLDKVTENESENKLKWDIKCSVNTIQLKLENWAEHLVPSLRIAAKHFSHNGDFFIDNPWINWYSYNGFQEIHCHPYFDIVGVFFINEGDNFGKLYFQDRMSGLLNDNVLKYLKISDTYIPKVAAGDLIIFPSYLFHGVTPHRSDKIRKTFSFNLRFA